MERERSGLGPSFGGLPAGPSGGGILQVPLGEGDGPPSAVAQLDDFGVTVCDRVAGRLLVVPWRSVGGLRTERRVDGDRAAEMVLDLPTAELRLQVSEELVAPGWVEDLAQVLAAHAPRPLPPLPDPPAHGSSGPSRTVPSRTVPSRTVPSRTVPRQPGPELPGLEPPGHELAGGPPPGLQLPGPTAATAAATA